MATKELPAANFKKLYQDPNYMPFNKSDAQPVVEVDGSGAVPISETEDIPGRLLTEVRGQTHALPSSEEGRNHTESEQQRREEIAQVVATTAIHGAEQQP